MHAHVSLPTYPYWCAPGLVVLSVSRPTVEWTEQYRSNKLSGWRKSPDVERKALKCALHLRVSLNSSDAGVFLLSDSITVVNIPNRITHAAKGYLWAYAMYVLITTACLDCLFVLKTGIWNRVHQTDPRQTRKSSVQTELHCAGQTKSSAHKNQVILLVFLIESVWAGEKDSITNRKRNGLTHQPGRHCSNTNTAYLNENRHFNTKKSREYE